MLGLGLLKSPTQPIAWEKGNGKYCRGGGPWVGLKGSEDVGAVAGFALLEGPSQSLLYSLWRIYGPS